MKKEYFYMLFFCLFAFASAAKDASVKLSFDETGKFKIVQFTDLHWNHNSPKCAVTTATIKHVLQTEKPRLAILTGDVVSDPPAREGWLAIAALFAEAKTPFAVTLGNHDAEPGISRDEIFDLLDGLPYFVGEKGPEDIRGAGNYVLPIENGQSETAALIYCFDSNDYPEKSKNGHYDWIHFDQIAWYGETSREYTLANKGVALPALAFFHIPFLEYNHVIGRNTTIGSKSEKVSSPEINSGLFASFVEMEDVMGVFAGHDHDNDFIGIDHDIALAFGRVTGADAYGNLERGARIIELYKDQRRFDTWIRTPKGKEHLYYFPSGISFADEESMDYLLALPVKPSKQGVRYAYYKGTFKQTEEMLRQEPMRQGTMSDISISSDLDEDYFGYEFRTLINIPEKGVYRFYTYSDDGSRLFIDNREVVDNDGTGSPRRKDGKVALEAGWHELKVRYFDSHMGQVLRIGFLNKNISERTFSPSEFFLPE